MNNDRSESRAGDVAHDAAGHNSEQREALVLGNGPRIPPLQVSELSADLLQIVTRMSQINSALALRERDTLGCLVSDGAAAATAAAVSNLSEIMRTMLRHPDLFVREIDIGVQLLTRGALSNRDRELAILRIGWLCQAPYEWGEHVLVAKHVGVSSEEIERITRGADAQYQVVAYYQNSLRLRLHNGNLGLKAR